MHDIRKINERLDVVEALVNDPSCRAILHDDILRRIPDIGVITRKVVQKKAGLQVLPKIFALSRTHCSYFVESSSEASFISDEEE